MMLTDRHAAYAAWIHLIALRNGVPLTPVLEAGMLTDRFELELIGLGVVAVIVPAPPADWEWNGTTPADWTGAL